jgi:hypothetical protein
MQCVKCGFDNPPEARFCGRCGEPVKAASPAPAVPAPPGESAAVSQGLKVGIIVGSVFVPLLGIIMGAIYQNDPNPEKKQVGRLWLYTGIGIFVLECLCGVVVGIMANSGGY